MVHFSTDDDLAPWPLGDPNDFVLGMGILSLYQLDVNFGATAETVYRVIGDSLRSTTGVFGVIRSPAGGGVIYLDHEDYPAQPPLPVVNGAFWGTRAWASVQNPRTGGTDSQPGRVSVRYVAGDGSEYLAQRNIDWGSWNGNQVFLFDTAEMIPVPGAGPLAGPVTAGAGPLVVHANHPNPFHRATEIRYTLSRPGPVEVAIYNVSGQRLAVLVSQWQEAGTHRTIWDTTGASHRRAARGVYFVRLTSGREVTTAKVVRAR